MSSIIVEVIHNGPLVLSLYLYIPTSSCFLATSSFNKQSSQCNIMGLSNFPSAAEGLLPLLVINTVLSLALFKNMLRSLLQVVAWKPDIINVEQELDVPDDGHRSCVARRRVSITQYRCMSDGDGTRWRMAECCVCLCGFQGTEEVSELSCKHFFHRACLDKWFLNRHTTCPLCRSSC